MEDILTFSQFVKMLYPYCGNGKAPQEFLRDLLSQITTKQENSIFNKEDSDFRKFYNGTRQISQKSASYILTKLDKAKFDTYLYDLLSEDALTELCNDFEPLVGNATKEDITTKLSELFMAILKSIADKEGTNILVKSNEQISDFVIERELTEIVKTLAKLPPEQMGIKLGYNPVNVDKKIPSDTTLKTDVRRYVIDYYVFVESLFKDASRQNSTFFDRIAEQIKYTCDNFISQNNDQEVIFDEMVDWLKKKVTYASDTACRIIISFFVQNCEVFHAIPE